MKLRSYKLRVRMDGSIELNSSHPYIPDTVLMVTDLEGLPGAWPNVVVEDTEQVVPAVPA